MTSFCLGNSSIMFKCIYNVLLFNPLMIYYRVVFYTSWISFVTIFKVLLYVQTTYLTEISKVIGFSYPHSCHFESKPSKGGQYIQCWNFTKFTFHVVKFKQVADIVPTWYHYEIDNLSEPHNQIHISCTISPFTVSLSICRGRRFELYCMVNVYHNTQFWYLDW